MGQTLSEPVIEKVGKTFHRLVVLKMQLVGVTREIVSASRSMDMHFALTTCDTELCHTPLSSLNVTNLKGSLPNRVSAQRSKILCARALDIISH